MLQGTTAEWIMEDPSYVDSSGTHPWPMPDFGATFFYDAIAGSKTQERDIDDATLVNMTSGSTTSARRYTRPTRCSRTPGRTGLSPRTTFR